MIGRASTEGASVQVPVSPAGQARTTIFKIVGRHTACFKSQFIVPGTVFEQRYRAMSGERIGCEPVVASAGFWDLYSWTIL